MRQRLKRLLEQARRWTQTRPGPSAERSADRVKLTPPTDDDCPEVTLARTMLEDIDAVLRHDPAARSALEVMLAYPGLHALWCHRVAHRMWQGGLVLLPRLVSHGNRFVTGIEIHPGARIGRRVFIDHGMGIVVGETATIGDDCLLYKGVVLGGTSLARAERHPTLGRGVVVGTNACILGAIQIGDGARVGSGSVVVQDVPEGATVVGVPGRIAASQLRTTRRDLDHADLPDPVSKVLKDLVEEVECLRAEVSRLQTANGGSGKIGGRRNEHDEFSDELDADGCS